MRVPGGAAAARSTRSVACCAWRGPEERPGATGRGGDPVAAALDLDPDHGLVEGREIRVATTCGCPARGPRSVTSRAASGYCCQPRPDGQHGDRGAPVVQQSEHPACEGEVAGAVEGQRDLAAAGGGVYQLTGGADRRGARRRARRGGLRHREYTGPGAPGTAATPQAVTAATGSDARKLRRVNVTTRDVHQALTWEFLYLRTSCSARRRRSREFARLGARQRGEHLPGAGPLVVGEPLRDVRLQRRDGERVAVAGHDDGVHGLAPLRRRQAVDGGVEHVGVLVQHRLDLGRVDSSYRR